MKRVLAAALLAVTMGAAPVQAARVLPYQNPAVPLDQRVGDLLGRLTLDEKISLLHQSQRAIPRLGIPYFKAGTEALHGVAWSNDHNDNWNQKLAGGTVFPQAVGLASTWDTELVKRVGSATGDEVRGYNAADPVLWGTQVWAPVVNLLRDPRWGRNEEGYSEDPLLTGAISTAYGRGLSGDDPVYLKTAPVLKHYLANNNEYLRSLTSSNLRPRVKKEYDEAAFKPAIAADAATGVMGSYNLVNGRPNTVNPDLGGLVRSWTDKELYNVSDAWAPDALQEYEHYFETKPEAVAATLKAGIDSFTINNDDPAPMTANLKSALAQGLITEADIDKGVRHALSIRIRLGQLDPDGGPYARITEDVINSAAHQRLNRETAGKAMVLLRNTGRKLPLPAGLKKVAVLGPLQDTLFSDWYGGVMPYKVTPLAGIKERLGARATVTGADALDRIALKDLATGKYVTATGTGSESVVVSDTAPGAASTWDQTDWTGDVSTLRNAGNGKLLTGNFGPYVTNSDTPTGWFVQQQFRLERQSDGTYLIQYVGYEVNEGWWPFPEHYVSVGADGTLGTGTKAQAARFAREVVTSGAKTAAQAAKGADAAVVVVGSNPFVYGRENHDRSSLALGQGQQELIKAVRAANPNTVVVLEDSYPTTMSVDTPALLWTSHGGAETGHGLADVLFGDRNPAGRLTQTWYRSDDLPDILNYDITKTGMTYLYHEGDPLYAFGHGLSYTTFGYQDLRVTPRGDSYEATVRVTNTGTRAGDEVVQLYTHQRSSRVERQPVKQLRGFARVSLRPGESRTVRITFKKADLALWDVTRGRWAVENATHDVMAGSSSADIRQRATLQVNGERIPPRDLTRVTRVIDFDDYQGVDLVDESKAAGEAVGASAGDWVKFGEADLRSRPAGLSADVASVSGGSFEVRSGSPAGPLLATVTAPATGDIYRYVATSATVSGANGVRDLYLVFRGDLRIRSIKFG
ncbi:glycoside hydrolase family 3 protein [Nonomuraea rhizosphaerae]|uniref:glycoside hydrolase family 3 protein n=1 Tax=Nonomuraea rhizosphaerae TaxID=2665663 RepID=UPI001C5D9B96|nr:glycoside hydrolase family 3 protein [Nonomuraea rhizosphaerae]